MIPSPPKQNVAIIVDAASHFGRAVARGAMQFVNLRRQWNIAADFRKADLRIPSWLPCDGAIVAGVTPAMLHILRQNIRHVVSCGTACEPSDGAVVCADTAACGRIAAEHLVDTHFRHFAFCGWSALQDSDERLTAFRQALLARGFDCHVAAPLQRDLADTIGTTLRSQTVSWLRQLPRPVGIFAYDDWVAYDLAAICHAEGIAVPDQAAILGVNNDDLLCPTAWPPLSSVEIDYHQVGYFAARQLQRLLSGETFASDSRILRILPMGVMRRQSTDVLAVRDRHVAAAIRFIRKHACDPCSIDDILSHVPVGRRWLERKFVELLDRTLHDEIQHVRLETAQRLLLDSDEKIERIAEQCGFANARTFIRAFHQDLATTPAAFRRAHFADVIARGA